MLSLLTLKLRQLRLRMLRVLTGTLLSANLLELLLVDGAAAADHVAGAVHCLKIINDTE